MLFYFTEPKAGTLWVFALDGGGPARVARGTNLTTIKGSLPKVGKPGHTLGGRVLAGYGFEAKEGGEPIMVELPAALDTISAGASNSADVGDADVNYRRLCFGCHKTGGGSAPKLFRTSLTEAKFADKVVRGGNGMPSYKTVLNAEQIKALHAFVSSNDGL